MFLLESEFIEFIDGLKDYSQKSFSTGRPLLEAVEDLMLRIYKDFKYDPGFSSIATPLIEVLKHRKGVCQDFAHLAIACLRMQGLAARYISGYLETVPPKGQKRLVGADASHAWFSVYVPHLGWVDFDPTNAKIPDEQHITAAWGRDYADVAPLKGVIFGGGDENILEVSVDVERL
jgi:transglutaminase-like putative cysteine protease